MKNSKAAPRPAEEEETAARAREETLRHLRDDQRGLTRTTEELRQRLGELREEREALRGQVTETQQRLCATKEKHATALLEIQRCQDELGAIKREGWRMQCEGQSE